MKTTPRRFHGFAPVRVLSVLLLPWLTAATGHADLQAPAHQPVENQVIIGTYINRVNGLNFRDSRFEVDFYIWFLWSDPGLDPGETWEIVNGWIDSKVESDAHQVQGGYYASYRVHATVIKDFDLYKYPLDRHRLEIEIEDGAPVQRLRYRPDINNSGLSDSFFAPGFRARQPLFTVHEHTYRTNYGDPDLGTDNASIYSRFTASFSVERPSAAAAWKLYIGVFVAALIGFLGLTASPEQTDVRFGLGSAALFAAIATQFVIASNMPENSTLIVPDIICIVTIAYVFLTLAQSGVALALAGRGRIALARRLDALVLALLLSSYFLICAWLILS